MTGFLPSKFVRYAVVGVLTLTTYLAIGQILHRLPMPALWQGSLSFAVAVTFSYFLQKTWVFHEATPTASSLPKYAVMIAIGYVINVISLIALSPRMPLLLAQLAAALLVVLSNAVLSFSWVFLKRGDGARAAAINHGRLP